MQRKFKKVGDLTVILDPPVNSSWGNYESFVSYQERRDWILPEGLGRKQPGRIEIMQRNLQSFQLYRIGNATLLHIYFSGRDYRGYFLNGLHEHLRSANNHVLVDDSQLRLCLRSQEDLTHVLSRLNTTFQLDPDTKADLESALQIKIDMTPVDAKIHLLAGRFDEVYEECVRRKSSRFCYKMGYHSLRYHKHHPEWAIKMFLSAPLVDEIYSDFGAAYARALSEIAKLIDQGEAVEFDVFHHVKFETLYSVLTTPCEYTKTTHHDCLYYLGVYCREIEKIEWAIQCFNNVAETDKNYAKACDALLHLEMQGYCTASTNDKAERMLRYALKGIPENRWMAQAYFAQLCGGAGLSPHFPGINTDVDSVVALAKYMRNMHDENAGLKSKVAALESELKKYKPQEVEITKVATLFARKTTKVVVASKSQLKIDAVIKALNDPETYQVIGVEVPSGVNEQPLNDETLAGARNRLENAMKLNTSGDIYIAIENGVYEVEGNILDKAVIIVQCRNTDNTFAVHEVFSDAVEFPKECFDIAKAKGFEKTTVAEVMLERGLVESSKDPHKSLGKKISRAVILEETLKRVDIKSKYRMSLERGFELTK